MSTTAPHVRRHDRVLAAAEKRLLVRTAERLPGWVDSNHLSALGLVSMAGGLFNFAGAELPVFTRS